MDWIFDNMFLVIIIISGIISVLSGGKKNEEAKKKRQSTPPQNRPQQRQQTAKSTMSHQPSRNKRVQPRAERQIYREESRPDISAGSVEEQQKEQMERLRSRYQTASRGDLEDLADKFKDLVVERQNEEESLGKREMKKRVSGNLDGKGLVNGIIMAEVLGAPRAKKPYRNAIQARK